MAIRGDQLRFGFHGLRRDLDSIRRDGGTLLLELQSNARTPVSTAEIFGHSLAELKRMDLRRVIRMYKQKAKGMHSDGGGANRNSSS